MGLRADWNQEKKESENRNYSIWKRGEKEEEKSEKEKKKSTNPKDLWHNIKRSNISIMWITKEDRENGTQYSQK